MSVPDLFAAHRVLCVQPHYDDNDIGAGGTIARLADAGAEVHYLTVTDDLAGVLDASLSDAEATRRLRAEQAEAGALIGVRDQHWLGYPDAGDWDVFAARREIVRAIRTLRPDLVLTPDPWLRHELHPDHLRTSRAVAEACMFHGLPRIRTDPEVDRGYTPHALTAIVFYFTVEPNLVVDIAKTRERKHRALDAYRAQFTPDQLKLLHVGLERKEREWASGKDFTHGEALRVMHPRQLHVGI
jgi:LmbE family N-acetylglucosaminyl deacetylase